ncbi:5-methylcytosine-specific restriction enzyme A [Duganella sp. CF402]|uniref:HNH endonuclease n=1 Tax=unclassified Duganella TaxID=2636909 RepID=UPI0008B09C3C|nr:MULTISPECIES: HNH endonuclease signature motif containing protein [unclassified Duganella]RZT05351.1 5-methylcytosine-specific restriction protein A [Duganella sp. BK701]SEN11089.1 5-methylcytosine-specific restriction enzyme A [Duganella sp. CF402]
MPSRRAQPKPIPHFTVGEVYDRRQHIHGPYGGSFQSGIAPSSVVDAIFIFTGDTGSQYGYADEEEVDAQGVRSFSYTGEGQVGDMEFVRGNRAILDHSNDGRALHLFQSLGKGKGQRYVGEFVYAGHKFIPGPDRNGDTRRLIVFRLVGVADAHAIEDAVGDEESVHTAISMTLADARRMALAAAAGGAMPAKDSAARTLYVRSKAVRDYVLMRAAGHCESCDQPAPFIRKNGTPYLEPHHTTRVSDGGPDHPRFVGAVCPACHRELHFGVGGEAKNAALQERLRALEPD